MTTLTPERIVEIEARADDCMSCGYNYDLSFSLAFMKHACEDMLDLLADRKQLFEKIEQLKADNQKLREALKPFAEAWRKANDCLLRGGINTEDQLYWEAVESVDGEMCRNAAKVLAETENEK